MTSANVQCKFKSIQRILKTTSYSVKQSEVYILLISGSSGNRNPLRGNLGSQPYVLREASNLSLVSFAFRDKIRKHLYNKVRSGEQKIRQAPAADLDCIKRTTSALRVELDTPHLFSGIFSGFDAFYGRIIAIYEKRLPSLRERVLQRQSILMVLTRSESLANSCGSLRSTLLPRDIYSSCFDGTSRSQS